MCAPVHYALFAGLERLILRNPAYDPRSLLQGVGSTLQALVHQVRPNHLLLNSHDPLTATAPAPTARLYTTACCYFTSRHLLQQQVC